MNLRLSVAFLFLSLCISCSFQYGDILQDGAIPEMVLQDVAVDRYENNTVSMRLTAAMLEMYGSERIWAARDMTFTQYSAETGEEYASGSAGLLLANEALEVYTLGDSIQMYLREDGMYLQATDLQWSKKNGVVTAPENGEVAIRKDDGTSIRGTGFIADTASHSYQFSHAVSGVLVRAPDTPAKSDDEPVKDFP